MNQRTKPEKVLRVLCAIVALAIGILLMVDAAIDDRTARQGVTVVQ